MTPQFSQQYLFVNQPSLDDTVARHYYLQVINAIHQYDMFQANELLQQRLPIDEEREEAQQCVKHVRWAEEVVEISEVLDDTSDEFNYEHDEEKNSDDELYRESSDPGFEEQFPESSERFTIQLSEQSHGLVICKEPDGPFQEPEPEEEKGFEVPFPKRAATEDFFKQSEAEFIVPFPRSRKRQKKK